MGVVMAACDQIIAFAEENNISEIAEIVFAIGEGSGVFEPYVRKVYPAVVKDTMLEKTELVIETVPGMAECLDCFEIYNVLENEGKCPECGSKMKEILSGTEFAIKEIHVPED